MLPRLGVWISKVFRAAAPDPFVLAIGLTALTAALALALTPVSPGALLDAWMGGAPETSRGVWGLLEFGMQMCLVLVTGHALAASRPVARLLGALSALPRTGRQGVWLVATSAIVFGLINWGLGLIVGAVLARDVGRAMRVRGARVPYALLAAAGYAGMMTWHGGLSGSAPLDAADAASLARKLGPELAASVGGSIPVDRTLLSALNLFVTGGLLLIVPALLALLCPRGGGTDAEQPPAPPPDGRPGAPPMTLDGDSSPGTLPRFLERSPLIVWALAAPVIVWLVRRFAGAGVSALDLNTAILAFLAAGLVLHGSASGYVAAVEDAARGCAGIILQFPLYAGIIAMMQVSGLATIVSRAAVDAAGGDRSALAVTTFLFAGALNLFVPSGGGQWAVQGPIALEAAVQAGADPARFVLAVAYGDQWTNMVQPFWALPLLGITRVRARDIVGYTALAMLAGGVWIALALAAF